jgi:hypothetical protein
MHLHQCEGRVQPMTEQPSVRWYDAKTEMEEFYRSKGWRRVCRVVGLRHRFTRPYHPPNNAKAERWTRVQPAPASPSPGRSQPVDPSRTTAGGVGVTNLANAYS